MRRLSKNFFIMTQISGFHFELSSENSQLLHIHFIR